MARVAALHRCTAGILLFRAIAPCIGYNRVSSLASQDKELGFWREWAMADSELKAGNILDFLLYLLGQRKLCRVTGDSMLPLLQPGEKVLLDPQAYCQTSPDIGDIVVARHPTQPTLYLVKRVALMRDDGSCLLLGDNPAASTDSRAFGSIRPEQILGRVTSRCP